MKTTVINIDENICNMIEALNYEVDSRKDVISFMLYRDMDMNTSSAKTYMKEYREYFTQYQTLKSELEKKYVLPILKDNEKSTWNLDFETRELTIKISEE